MSDDNQKKQSLQILKIYNFRPAALIYFVGPKSCGKSSAMARLRAEAWLSWKPHAIQCFEFRTFMCIPKLNNQYFVLFRDSLKYLCAKTRVSEAVQDHVDNLTAYECLVYDADMDVTYNPCF